MWKKVMKCGARGSRLSVAQTELAISCLKSSIDGFNARLITFDTPGDRDLSTPLEKSAPDFFTRDLDDALRDGLVDFAVHSAKDVPYPVADDLDWFWLPIEEDPSDCIVFRRGDEKSILKSAKRRIFRIGVSSERRCSYARRRFPKAKLMPIRGAVDSRLAQIAEGKYDIVLMATAGLKRLFPEWKEGPLPFADLAVLPISLRELPSPEGQGRLAVVYRKGDARMNEVRRAFVKAVRFTSAGIGNPGTMTLQSAKDLEEAEIVLADELSGAVKGDSVVEWVDVGKRCGAHTMPQSEITSLICDEVRKGKRVVRLKGGDAGLFGRLSEETDALRELGIPFLVRPGVSALVAATTPNGLLLTKRGEAAGFSVCTPRSSGGGNPHVFFMAARMARDVLKGFPPDTPYAMVYDACGAEERVVRGVCASAHFEDTSSPGLLVVGYAGIPFVRRRVLVTCSRAVMPRAVCLLEDKGFDAVEWPMISLSLSERVSERLEGIESRYDAIVLTSPVAVRMFFSAWKQDRRRIPEIWTCGAGTDKELRTFGLRSDLMPETDFSADGLIERIRLEGARVKGMRVLRLRSSKASHAVASAIGRMGGMVDDVVLYGNKPVTRCGVPLPDVDAVFFASVSGVEAFVGQYGARVLSRKEIYVIGMPTRNALPLRLRGKAHILPLAAPKDGSF